MNLQKFLTSDFGTRFWMALARWLPPGIAHPLSDAVTGLVARRRHSIVYQILYSNQAHVLGPSASDQQIHQSVRDVLSHGVQVTYDLMHLIARGEEAVRTGIVFGPELDHYVQKAAAQRRGVMVCGCHLSNFNLGLVAFALGGFPVQILSVAQPAGGFKLMQEMRSRGMIEETPIDGSSLRKAIRRLRAGGFVGTGIDWPPAADPDERLTFFGAPAMLPTGHIRIAIAANALLMPITARWEPGRGYYALIEEPLDLELTGDRETDVRHNAVRLLRVIEKWIRETPGQWLMYHRVWPEDQIED